MHCFEIALAFSNVFIYLVCILTSATKSFDLFVDTIGNDNNGAVMIINDNNCSNKENIHLI